MGSKSNTTCPNRQTHKDNFDSKGWTCTFEPKMVFEWTLQSSLKGKEVEGWKNIIIIIYIYIYQRKKVEDMVIMIPFCKSKYK